MKKEEEEKRRREERERWRRAQIRKLSDNIVKEKDTIQYQEKLKKLQELQKLQKLQKFAPTKKAINEKIEEKKLEEEEKKRLAELAVQIAGQQSQQSRVDMAKAAMKEQEDDELDR